MIILNVAGVNHDLLHIAERIYDDMPLPSIDLFSSIVAAFAASFGSFGASAIQVGGAGIRLAAASLAHSFSQQGIDLLPGSALERFATVIIDAIVVRIFTRHILPWQPERIT